MDSCRSRAIKAERLVSEKVEPLERGPLPLAPAAWAALPVEWLALLVSTAADNALKGAHILTGRQGAAALNVT